MEVTLKQFKYQKTEIKSKTIKLPIEPCYFYEPEMRCYIKVVPIFTDLLNGKELRELVFICVHQLECKIEKFIFAVNQLPDIYYSEKHVSKMLINSFCDGDFKNKKKDDFDAAFNNVLLTLQ